MLFRGGDGLQRLETVRLVAFDKTGTLTEGRPVLTGIWTAPGVTETELLASAAGAEAGSEHPLAKALQDAAARRGIDPVPSDGAVAMPGKGLSVRQHEAVLRLGTAPWLRELGVDMAPAADVLSEAAAAGQTPVCVALDGRLLGILRFADRIRPEAAEAIAGIKALGYKTALISGDTPAAAEAVARKLGIDYAHGGLLPDQKAAELSDLRAAHGPVAFVGDGLNDAPALASADTGIAIGGGTDVAVESADVVLMRSNPAAVLDAIDTSRCTMANIRQNLGWAFGYNILLIPVAAGGLWPLWGLCFRLPWRRLRWHVQPRRCQQCAASQPIAPRPRADFRSARASGATRPMTGPMRAIGAAAEAAALPIKTIRYYEEIGLITPQRDANGYRVFGDTDIHRLVFVGRARGLGFSIADCRALLALYDDQGRESSEVRKIAQANLERIDAKMAELSSMRATLAELVRCCAGDTRPECPILDGLARTPPPD